MRILIVKTSSLGDIIHAFPVLDYIKQCQPGCEIDWVVERPFAELVSAHPLVCQTIVIQTKKWRSQVFDRSSWKEIALFYQELRRKSYDFVLDLQGNVKSGFITGLAKSAVKAGFDYSAVAEWPNLLVTHKKFHPPSGGNIRQDYLFLAKKIMGDIDHSSIPNGVKLNLSAQDTLQLQPILDSFKELQGLKVLACFGSNWPNKQLSKETLKDFLHSFSSNFKSQFFFSWGNSAEKAMAEEIAADFPLNGHLIDRLSLPALQNLMTHVDLVLAMDSLPLHLAGTTSTSTYSVFGASSSKKYKPMGDQHQAFQGKCPYGNIFEKRCKFLRTCKTGACMKQLEGNTLFNHFYDWWTALKK